MGKSKWRKTGPSDLPAVGRAVLVRAQIPGQGRGDGGKGIFMGRLVTGTDGFGTTIAVSWVSLALKFRPDGHSPASVAVGEFHGTELEGSWWRPCPKFSPPE